jgi:hypothetical protein
MHAARPAAIRTSGSAVERDILDRELAELALEWMMNPQSPPVSNLSRIR